TLTKEKQNTNYIRYSSDSDYKFEVNKEYVVILNKQKNNIYTVYGNGYGVFKSNNKLEKSLDSSYENVLTGDNFEF
ncbi:MAG: hypothetical protein ACRDA5_15355, partial [Clostridium sp.]